MIDILKFFASGILLFMLGAIIGYYINDRYVSMRFYAEFDSVRPLILRKPFNQRQMNAMGVFMDKHAIAVVDCRSCKAIFIKRILCPECKSKGYITISSDEIMDMDLPSWKGFFKVMEKNRFENLVDKGVIKEKFQNERTNA